MICTIYIDVNTYILQENFVCIHFIKRAKMFLTLCNISHMYVFCTYYLCIQTKLLVSFYQTTIWGIRGRNGDYTSLKLNSLLSLINQVKSGLIIIINDRYRR